MIIEGDRSTRKELIRIGLLTLGFLFVFGVDFTSLATWSNSRGLKSTHPPFVPTKDIKGNLGSGDVELIGDSNLLGDAIDIYYI